MACVERSYRLAKRDDHSCVYLEDDLCSIYAQRPNVCREFRCQGGWRLSGVFPPEASAAVARPLELDKEAFVERLNDALTFVQHPLLKVRAAFYLKPRREIVLLKETVGACGKSSSRDAFDYPSLDDDSIMTLIDLFGRTEPLGEVHRRFVSQTSCDLTLHDFYEIVWILNKHSVVLDSRNFGGMLSGVGAIA